MKAIHNTPTIKSTPTLSSIQEEHEYSAEMSMYSTESYYSRITRDPVIFVPSQSPQVISIFDDDDDDWKPFTNPTQYLQ